MCLCIHNRVCKGCDLDELRKIRHYIINRTTETDKYYTSTMFEIKYIFQNMHRNAHSLTNK